MIYVGIILLKLKSRRFSPLTILNQAEKLALLDDHFSYQRLRLQKNNALAPLGSRRKWFFDLNTPQHAAAAAAMLLASLFKGTPMNSRICQLKLSSLFHVSGCVLELLDDDDAMIKKCLGVPAYVAQTTMRSGEIYAYYMTC
jgi:hypothetical protein